MTNKNLTLNQFKEFPSNFLDWLTQFPTKGIIPAKYTLEEAKKIYKENSEKEIGFTYRKYTPKCATLDNAWYDDHDFIPSINMEICSIGNPALFFGSTSEYKNLLNELMVEEKSILSKSSSSIDLKNFYQFGKIYLFDNNTIKNPIDIF